MPLSAAELSHYHDRGYVIPDFRLPATLVSDLRASLDGLLAAYRDVAPEDLANPHMLPPAADGANAFMRAATHPGILDMLEQVLGPDIVLWITRVLCKPAATGREVPWHQDGEYWPMRPLATCSVWIALDPVSTANGCMRFIPGSHRESGTLRHHVTDRKDVVLNLELDRDQFDESAAVNVELEPGQMSLHDVRLVHGSLANTSGQRRGAFIMRYMPASSHYEGSLVDRRRIGKTAFDISQQPLWLVRGESRCAQNDFTLGHGAWRERYAAGLVPVLPGEG